MGDGQEEAGYHVIVDLNAEEDLANLDQQVRERIAKKIDWLGQNAADIPHKRLSGLPEHLRGLCKYRVGDYRILYWVYHDEKLLRIYGVIHRRTRYRVLWRRR